MEENRPWKGVVVLELHGDVDLHVADEVRDRIATAIADGASLLVLDLSDASFLDSATLGVLVAGARRAKASGAQLRLVVPSPAVRRIFEVASLDRVLLLDPTRADALASAAAPG